MRATWNGVCWACEGTYVVNDEVVKRGRHWICVRCAPGSDDE